MRPNTLTTPIRTAVVGYGYRDGKEVGYAMGRLHAQWIAASSEFRLAAVCDLDPACLKAAEEDFPGAATYQDVTDLLADAQADLVIVVTPHSSHAPLAIACLEAGKNVVVDKPMCISVAEADAMITKAGEADRTLTVYHSRGAGRSRIAIPDKELEAAIADRSSSGAPAGHSRHRLGAGTGGPGRARPGLNGCSFRRPTPTRST